MGSLKLTFNSHPMKFHCPNCGQKISAEDDRGGQIVNCPVCLKSFTIPTPQLPQISEPQMAPHPNPPVQRGEGSFCPNGHGELEIWSGQKRCFTCGWPDENAVLKWKQRAGEKTLFPCTNCQSNVGVTQYGTCEQCGMQLLQKGESKKHMESEQLSPGAAFGSAVGRFFLVWFQSIVACTVLGFIGGMLTDNLTEAMGSAIALGIVGGFLMGLKAAGGGHY